MKISFEHFDLINANIPEFRINSDLEVFFGNTQIGHFRINKNHDPEGDDVILLFLPGMVYLDIHTDDIDDACAQLLEQHNNEKRN